jgi:hypothetical protein
MPRPATRLGGDSRCYQTTDEENEMDAQDLMDFAHEWTCLGNAVQEQVKDVLDRGDDASVNPAAIRMAIDGLGNVRGCEAVDEILTPLGDWMAANGEV